MRLTKDIYCLLRLFQSAKSFLNAYPNYRQQTKIQHAKTAPPYPILFFGIIRNNFATTLIWTTIFIFCKPPVQLAKIFHSKHLSVNSVNTLCYIRKSIALWMQTKQGEWYSLYTADFCHLHNKVFHFGECGIFISLRFKDISGRIVHKRQPRILLFWKMQWQLFLYPGNGKTFARSIQSNLIQSFLWHINIGKFCRSKNDLTCRMPTVFIPVTKFFSQHRQRLIFSPLNSHISYWIFTGNKQ